MGTLSGPRPLPPGQQKSRVAICVIGSKSLSASCPIRAPSAWGMATATNKVMLSGPHHHTTTVLVLATPCPLTFHRVPSIGQVIVTQVDHVRDSLVGADITTYEFTRTDPTAAAAAPAAPAAVACVATPCDPPTQAEREADHEAIQGAKVRSMRGLPASSTTEHRQYHHHQTTTIQHPSPTAHAPPTHTLS